MMASLAACSAKEAAREISHRTNPDVLVNGGQSDKSDKSDEGKSNQDPNGTDLNGNHGNTNGRFTTACTEYPCGIATRRVSPAAAVAPGIEGFKVVGSVSLARELGVDDLQLLSDGTIVARANDGSVHWIQQTADGGGTVIASYTAIKGTRASLVVLPNDQVVASNQYGELFWLDRGTKVAQLKYAALGFVHPDDMQPEFW